MASDPRDHYFSTPRFEHGAQREFTKQEIMRHLNVGLTITTHIHMEVGP
jgi:hypothetical protein